MTTPPPPFADELIWPVRFNKDRDGFVYWDAEDYPIPNGFDHESFLEEIKKTLLGQGCAKVSIHAYATKLSDDLRQKYKDAQIIIHEKGDMKAVWEMYVDILIFSVDRTGKDTNLFVLSKQLPEDMIFALEVLYGRGFGIFLSKIEPQYALPSESNSSFLTDLFNTKKRRRDSTDLLTLESQGLSPTVYTDSVVPNLPSYSIAKELPEAPSNYANVVTCVFLVLKDGSVLFSQEPDEFIMELVEDLARKSYFGNVSIYGHLYMKPPPKKHSYSHYGVFTTNIQGAGFNSLLAHILCTAKLYSHCPINLLILTDDDKFGQGTRFPEFLACLQLKPFNAFNLVITQIGL